MVVRRRKKVTKYRAHSTHGGGHGKKRRGAGSRGGRGNAGTGKRAGHKVAGRPPSLGRTGFRPRREVTVRKGVNLGYFTRSIIDHLVAEGKATRDKDSVVLDLGVLGYTKLLGMGDISSKLTITVATASASAIEKVTAAGGKVVTTAVKASEKSSEKSPESAAKQGKTKEGTKSVS